MPELSSHWMDKFIRQLILIYLLSVHQLTILSDLMSLNTLITVSAFLHFCSLIRKILTYNFLKYKHRLKWISKHQLLQLWAKHKRLWTQPQCFCMCLLINGKRRLQLYAELKLTHWQQSSLRQRQVYKTHWHFHFLANRLKWLRFIRIIINMFMFLESNSTMNIRYYLIHWITSRFIPNHLMKSRRKLLLMQLVS